jgi:murein DD-endopeptidase MepM/ murein hydrolase activator NlpD
MSDVELIARHDNAEPFSDPFGPSRRPVPSDFRPVNWRWLAASALIGVFGAALMGSSLSTFDSERFAAQRPEKAASARHDEPAPGSGARKGDSLIAPSFSISTMQRFRAPLTEAAAGREITKVHALAHVSLVLATAPVAGLEIPAFDAARALADSGVAPTQQEAIDPSDADVSVTRRDLSAVTIPSDSPGLPDSAIEEQIAEMARLSAGSPELPPDYSNQRLLSRTLRMVGEAQGAAEPEAFGSLDVRIVPENVTSVAVASDSRDRYGQVDVVLDHGQTLASALAAHGASHERVAAIVSALGGTTGAQRPEGQHLRLLIGPERGGGTIQRVTLFDEDGPQDVVAEDDRGRFLRVVQTGTGHNGARPATDEDEQDNDTEATVTLYESAYASALKSGVPRDVIEVFVHAFASGMDLKQHVDAGDRLELVFTDDEGAAAGHRDLLYAGLSVAGEKQELYRHVAPGSGTREFLDESGVSLTKLLLRKPVQGGRISSPFGMRYHPILRYGRLHNGVDWAAQRGTPIMAAGDGTVAAAGPRSGYGNRVELEHANGYATAYNHMASIARQARPGASVHMGEIIGFVGTTGLSTGPHVHYEVTTNGHFVDPMKVKLPSSRILHGSELADFIDQKRQIDGLRHHAEATVMAQPGHPPG